MAAKRYPHPRAVEEGYFDGLCDESCLNLPPQGRRADTAEPGSYEALEVNPFKEQDAARAASTMRRRFGIQHEHVGPGALGPTHYRSTAGAPAAARTVGAHIGQLCFSFTSDAPTAAPERALLHRQTG